MTVAKQVWPLVIRDMIERNEMGADKYNRYLQTNCPDDMLQHAYEEALDLAVYLKTQIEKQKLIAEKQQEEKKEQQKYGLTRLSEMDAYNRCVSSSRGEDLQRNAVPGFRFII